MEYEELKKCIREAISTQFTLFDGPEVKKLRKPRPKMSDEERKKRKEERAIQKKIEADKECERKWAEHGVYQTKLFDDNDRNLKKESKMIDDIISEQIGNTIKEITEKSTNKLTHSKKIHW